MKCPDCGAKMNKTDVLICGKCRDEITRMNYAHFPQKEDNYDVWLSLVRRGYYLRPNTRNQTNLFWWNE